jgi:hypothetical protein
MFQILVAALLNRNPLNADDPNSSWNKPLSRAEKAAIGFLIAGAIFALTVLGVAVVYSLVAHGH